MKVIVLGGTGNFGARIVPRSPAIHAPSWPLRPANFATPARCPARLPGRPCRSSRRLHAAQ